MNASWQQTQARQHRSEGQYSPGAHSLLALILDVSLCMTACVCAILDLCIAYFEQIFGKILAVVQSFQVADELRTGHPLANVLGGKSNLKILNTNSYFIIIFKHDNGWRDLKTSR